MSVGPVGRYGRGGRRRSAAFNLPAPEGERLQESCQGAGETCYTGEKFGPIRQCLQSGSV